MRLSTSQIEAIKQNAQHLCGHHLHTRQHGFTLIELVTIIVILGILAVAAAPRFFDRNVFDSRGFNDQVTATLRHAQKTAIAQRRFVCVSFTANSLTLTYDTTAPSTVHTAMTACPGGSNLTSPTGAVPYTVTSANASFFGGAPAAFYFNALGRPSFAAQRNITVNGYATTPILIEAETGYVH